MTGSNSGSLSDPVSEPAPATATSAPLPKDSNNSDVAKSTQSRSSPPERDSSESSELTNSTQSEDATDASNAGTCDAGADSTPKNDDSTTEPATEQTNSSQSLPSTAYSRSGSHESTGSHLYVYELDSSVEESLLQAAVGPMAAALGCIITTVRVGRDSSRQKHLGYAYINFLGPDDAARVADALEPFFVNNALTRVIPFQDRTKFVRPPRPPPIQFLPEGVFIKNIHPAATARDIYDAFLPFGSISWCRLAVNEYGQSRGFAYVTYSAPATETQNGDSSESGDEKPPAARAIEAMSNIEFFGRRLFVGQNLPKRSMLSRYDEEPSSGEFRNLFVRGINMTVTEQVFYDLFAAIGEIESYSMPLDDYFNHRGYGFVRYKDPEAAKRAISELNGVDVEGRTLQVARAQQRNTSNYGASHGRHHHPQNQNQNHPQNQNQNQTQNQLQNAGYPQGQNPYNMYQTFSPYLPYSPAALSPTGSTPQASPGPYRRHSLYPPLSSRSGSQGAERQASPSNGASTRANLYIQHFAPSVTDAMLAAEFGRFGQIVSAKVMLNELGESRGFGFVCFENYSDAERAIEEMNGKSIWGGTLYVAHALRKEKPKYARHTGNGGSQKRPPRAASIPTSGVDQPVSAGSAGSAGRAAPYYYVPVPYPAYYTAASAAAEGMAPYVPANMSRLTPQQLGYGTSLAAAVASAENEEAEKQVIGEALYPKVMQHSAIHGDDVLASQITGILLNQSQSDLLQWVDNDSVLSRRIQQAVDAYQDYAARSQ